MDAAEKIPLDAAHRCLADERRRAVIGYLRETEDGTASLDELGDHVGAREQTSRTLDRAAVTSELYHVHLPMLADAGILDFDSQSGTVEYSTFETIEQILDAV